MTTRTAPASVPRVLVSRARVHVEDPLLLGYLEVITVVCFLVFALIFRREEGAGLGLSELLLGVSLAAGLYALWSTRPDRTVRASVEGNVLALRGWLSTFRVHPRDVARLRTEHHPCCMRIVLCDGRVVEIAEVDTRLAWMFEARVAQFRGAETFKVAGIPRRGWGSKCLSAIPVLSGLVRPRLRISKELLRIWWGPFSLERSLCQLTHATVTVTGVLLRFTDGFELEILTYGGQALRRRCTTLELSRIVAERILEARRRELSRSILGYRKSIKALVRDNG